MSTAKRKSSTRGGQRFGALRDEPSSPQAGFTYGYQWSEHRPPPKLKFPIEGHTRDGAPIRVYPAVPSEHSFTNPIELLIEDYEQKVTAERWHHEFLIGRGTGHPIYPDVETIERIRIALDWHVEHGFSVNPFVVPQDWPTEFQVDLNGHHVPKDPIEWVDRLVGYAWRRHRIGEGFQGTIWWLDSALHLSTDWEKVLMALGGRVITYEVRSLDVWGNERDGYEVNNSWRIGTITIRENAPDENIFQALTDAGFLRADAPEGITLEDNGDGFIEITGPEVAIPVPEFRWQDNFDGHPSYLEQPFMQELWEWAWQKTLDRNFGEGPADGAEPPEENDIMQWLRRDHFNDSFFPRGNGEPPSPPVMAEMLAIVRRAVDLALEAHRSSESRMPLFQLQRIDDGE